MHFLGSLKLHYSDSDIIVKED